VVRHVILLSANMIISLSIIIGLLALGLLILGIQISRRRVVVLSGQLMTLFLAICFLPTPIRVIFEMLEHGFDLAHDWIGFVPLFMLVLVIAIAARSFGRLTIFNIEEDVLYEALQGILSELGIQHQEKRGTILLPTMNGEIKLSTHAVFKSANLSTTSIDESNRAAIFKGLKQRLSTVRFEKNPVVGWINILLSGFLIVLLFALSLRS